MGFSTQKLREYDQTFLDEFRDYLTQVESAFLGDGDISLQEIHRGKHFLAHGVMGQFSVKQQMLFPALNSNGRTQPVTELLTSLHERCYQRIRTVHDDVNTLTQPQPPESVRREKPIQILKTLYQLDALMEAAFELESTVFDEELLDSLSQSESDKLDQQLKKATQQTEGCSSHGKHRLSKES